LDWVEKKVDSEKTAILATPAAIPKKGQAQRFLSLPT